MTSPRRPAPELSMRNIFVRQGRKGSGSMIPRTRVSAQVNAQGGCPHGCSQGGCYPAVHGGSHGQIAQRIRRRLRRQSRGASGNRDSTVSHRAAHDNTAALLHGTSCGQIERSIRAVPAEALMPLSLFPFRAQTGHEARAIPVGHPCQDGDIGNENFDLAPPLFPRSQPCTRGQS